MAFNKKFFTTGGIVASSPTAAEFDPLQNFETVTYTGNGDTQKITGYIRKGAAFTSTSQITTPIDFDGTTANGESISFWFNIPTGTTNFRVFEAGTLNSGASILGYFVIGSITGDFPNESFTIIDFDNTGDRLKTAVTEGHTQYIDGDWHHAVVISTSTTKQVYIDGNLKTLSYNKGSASTDLTFLDLKIASTSNTGSGKIDQVRIFNKALSSSEVTTLYGETYASSTKSTTDIFGDGSGVALYELDDSANDTGVAIDSGQSGDFNGSNSIRTVYSIDFGNSISMWVNLNSNITNGSTVGLWYQGDDPNPFTGSRLIKNSSNNFEIQTFIRLGTDYLYQRNTSVDFNSEWNHLVFKVNNSTGYEFYLNGNSITLSNWVSSGSFANVNFSSQSGNFGEYKGTYFEGQIDDVRYYSDLLTNTEIGYLASNDTTNIATISNFVAHYKLDGDATDSQGSNNGTWSGTESYSTPALLQYNGTPTNINFLGMAFQPDLVWIKQRDNTRSHRLTDSVRGANKIILSNDTSQELIRTDEIGSFDSNGFTIGANVGVNDNTGDYVAWCWKAGGAAVSNTDGSITSTVSANQDAGFSIGTYSGNSTAGATIGHGLSSAPELIIVKLRSGLPPKAWTVYHKDLGNTDYLYLNTDRATSAYNFWNNTSPTDSVFSVSSDTNVNSSSGDYVFYAFHSVDGYQKVGSYTGTGSSGNKQTTGFQPRFVMIKTTSTTGSWAIVDGVRPNANYLFADTSAAETSSTFMNLESDGFSFTGATGNDGSVDFIYLAIA